MVYKSSYSITNYFWTLVVCLIMMSLKSNSQNQIIKPFIYVFDISLNKIDSENFFTEETIYVIISHRSCSACINYFISNKAKVQYIFYINAESLLETKSIASNYFPNNKAYVFFYDKAAINLSQFDIDSDMKSPTLLYYKKGIFTFYSYENLSRLTNEFKTPFKKIKLNKS